MASKRQIFVGGVPIGGGAPVAVQTMTKTETANLEATMDQIHKVAEAGADLVRCAVPRDEDAVALKTIVERSPIPVIADIHFNYTLALKAIDAGAHCIRLNPGNIGGREKVAEVAAKATKAGVPMRIGVNSGSLPKHLHELERDKPVEALVTAAVEFAEMMESLDFEDFKISIKSTNVPNTIAANRLLSERVPYPIHLGITEAGTKWSGSLKSAVGLGTLLADGVGDTIRISLSTFHAEEEVKVAWEILKALHLRERGPVLIACPTCGRLQFDMDSVVAEIETRLEAYTEPIEVAVLGCAVNGIGEASHADFGITGAKNEGLIFAGGKPLRKVPQEELVEALFAEIDKSLDRGSVEVDAGEAAEGAEWLARIEEENADDLTPERIAAMEAAKAREEGNDVTAEPFLKPVRRRPALDEEASPTAGRRFTPRLSEVVHEAASVGFKRSAEAYDRARPDYPAAAIDRFARALALERGSRVIDVGAGTGKLTGPLTERGVEALAVEPVAEMRGRIAARAPDATTADAVAERLPAADGWADAVVAGQAFHWFATDVALAEFARCLRPEGRLGLIWNRRAAGDPVQTRITAMLEPLRGDAPRQAAGAWREVFEHPGPFEQRDGFELEFVQQLDRDGLVDRVGSISFVAALDERRRGELLAEVAELCPRHGTIGLAYVCEAFVYGRP